MQSTLIIALTLLFQNQFFENDKKEKETNERVNKSCFSYGGYLVARARIHNLFLAPQHAFSLEAAPFLPKLNNAF